MELLERSEELDLLAGRLAAAKAGAGSVVFLDGVAGIGKTALLESACAAASEAGMAVLRGRAGQLEVDLTWSLTRQLFAPVIGAEPAERERLLAGAAALAQPALGLGEGEESGTLHGLYWLVAGMAQGQPLLLAVDDAHWADDPSLRCLAYIANRLDDLPVVLLLSVRRGERRRRALEALEAQPATKVLQPRPLSSAASAALTRRRLGDDASAALCASCHEASGGNPFLLNELLSQLRLDGSATAAEATAQVREATPARIARAVLDRLSRLPASAGELAIAVAVAGGTASLALAGALTGLDPGAAGEAATALEEAGVLSGLLPLAFVHPIVRDVIYDDLPPAERDRRHRETARILAAGGAPPEQIAGQLMETEPGADPWVAERLGAAASEALSTGAPSAAIPLLRRALREQVPDAARVDLLMSLGRAEARDDLEGTGPMREALKVAEEPGRRAEIGLELGRTLGLAGRHDEAVETFVRALAEPHGDPDMALRLEAELAGHCLHSAAKLPLGFETLAAAVSDDHEGRGPAGRLVDVIAAFGLVSSARVDADSAAATAMAAASDRELLEEEGSSLFFFIAETLAFAGHLDEAIGVLDMMLADARARGSRPGVALTSAFRAQVSMRRGAVLEAAADGRTAFEIVDPAALGYCRPYALSFLVDALVERAELEEAAALIAEMGPPSGWPSLWQYGILAGSRGRLRLAEGRAAEAAEDFLECGRRLAPWRPRNPATVPWRSEAALALAACGEREEAARLAAWELEHADAMGDPRLRGVALRARGVAVGGEAGVAALREAVAELSAPTARLERARAVTDLGATLRREGARAQAREPLRAGLDQALECGSVLLAGRAREELLATGARPRRPRSSGVESLTASELRVAQMAVAGQTNREIAESLFVSRRTVETHLTRVYRKLEIDSRQSLAAALDENLA